MSKLLEKLKGTSLFGFFFCYVHTRGDDESATSHRTLSSW